MQSIYHRIVQAGYGPALFCGGVGLFVHISNAWKPGNDEMAVPWFTIAAIAFIYRLGINAGKKSKNNH